MIPKGTIVLGTRHLPGWTSDHWAVGYYRPTVESDGTVIHMLTDFSGQAIPVKRGGFAKVRPIRPDVAAWLVRAAGQLKAAPAQTVSLWTMLDESAFADCAIEQSVVGDDQ